MTATLSSHETASWLRYKLRHAVSTKPDAASRSLSYYRQAWLKVKCVSLRLQTCGTQRKIHPSFKLTQRKTHRFYEFYLCLLFTEVGANSDRANSGGAVLAAERRGVSVSVGPRPVCRPACCEALVFSRVVLWIEFRKYTSECEAQREEPLLRLNPRACRSECRNICRNACRNQKAA